MTEDSNCALCAPRLRCSTEKERESDAEAHLKRNGDLHFVGESSSRSSNKILDPIPYTQIQFTLIYSFTANFSFIRLLGYANASNSRGVIK